MEIENYLQKIDSVLEDHVYANDTLFMGNLGRLLYFMYRYRTSDNAKFGALASEILDQIFLNLNSGNSGIVFTSALSNGLSGLTTITGLLQEDDFLALDIDETIQQFEEIIFKRTIQQINEGNFDYLHGSIGSLQYFTTRVKQDTKVEKYIAEIIEKLEQQAIFDDKGLRFNNLIINNLNDTPDEINLGFAHGLSGIISVLLKVYETGICQNKVEKIIREALKYTISSYQEVDFLAGKFAHFPSVINEKFALTDKENQQAYRSFLGWCYGDLNQVILLYKAGKLLNEPRWIALADKVGKTTMLRTIHYGTQIKDAFLCHGASGLALMYQYILTISKDENYQKGIDYWLEQTLNYLKKYDWTHEPQGSLLGGIEGLGLALMTLQTDKKVLWTRIFLL
ncbi:MAG: lanthionine synthetase LanC family protein [Bacteroidota bacterium]